MIPKDLHLFHPICYNKLKSPIECFKEDQFTNEKNIYIPIYKKRNRFVGEKSLFLDCSDDRGGLTKQFHYYYSCRLWRSTTHPRTEWKSSWDVISFFLDFLASHGVPNKLYLVNTSFKLICHSGGTNALVKKTLDSINVNKTTNLMSQTSNYI